MSMSVYNIISLMRGAKRLIVFSEGKRITLQNLRCPLHEKNTRLSSFLLLKYTIYLPINILVNSDRVCSRYQKQKFIEFSPYSSYVSDILQWVLLLTLPFKSRLSGYSRSASGNFSDLPGNLRKILLFQKILFVNPKSQRQEPVEVKSVYFPSIWQRE